MKQLNGMAPALFAPLDVGQEASRCIALDQKNSPKNAFFIDSPSAQ
ncbi:hypothetical protein [Thauera humireducens]